MLAATPEGAEILASNVATQQAAGCDWIQPLSQQQLSAKFPWCHSADILLGAHSLHSEGFFDPWSYLSVLKLGCSALGVQKVDAEVQSLTLTADRSAISSLSLKQRSGAPPRDFSDFDVVVLSAGAWSYLLLQPLEALLNVTPLPVRRRRRSIFHFHCQSAPEAMPPASAPLTVDPSGRHIRQQRRLPKRGLS